MSDAQREAGKKWIVETFQRLGDEWNIAPERYGWIDQRRQDFDKQAFPFEVASAHGQEVVTFSSEDIEDCCNDDTIRRRLERSLEELVQRHSPKTLKNTGLRRSDL